MNDLVPPDVPLAEVIEALADLGVPTAERTVVPARGVRAVLTPTAAGTVVTLETRSARLHPRGAVLRGLTRTLERLLRTLAQRHRPA